MSDPSFRASLPPGFATGGSSRMCWKAAFTAFWPKTFAIDSDAAGGGQSIAEEFVSTRAPMLPRQSHNLLVVDALWANDWVGSPARAHLP